MYGGIFLAQTLHELERTDAQGYKCQEDVRYQQRIVEWERRVQGNAAPSWIQAEIGGDGQEPKPDNQNNGKDPTNSRPGLTSGCSVLGFVRTGPIGAGELF